MHQEITALLSSSLTFWMQKSPAKRKWNELKSENNRMPYYYQIHFCFALHIFFARFLKNKIHKKNIIIRNITEKYFWQKDQLSLFESTLNAIWNESIKFVLHYGASVCMSQRKFRRIEFSERNGLPSILTIRWWLLISIDIESAEYGLQQVR